MEKKPNTLKYQMVGSFCGAIPGVFLWFLGAQENVWMGVLFFGFIIGELLAIAIGNSITANGDVK